jgi:DNA-binding transcriptional regulator YhcF (GntR family)
MLLPSTPRLSQSPSDQFIVTQRTRTRRDYAQIAKALRRRTDLSDGAYRTYLEIIEFDWEDKSTGTCKGYVFPSLATLAKMRGVTVRTIERHIRELISLGLLSRERRRNQVSVLYIEELANEPERQARRSDKNVTSIDRREATKMSIVYIDEIITTDKPQQDTEHVDVVDQLIRLRINQHTAEQLARSYPRSYIYAKVNLLQHKLSSQTRGQPIVDTAGWLIRAIEQDYHVPPQLTTIQQAQPKRQAEVYAIDEEQGTVTIVEVAVAPQVEEGRG